MGYSRCKIALRLQPQILPYLFILYQELETLREKFSWACALAFCFLLMLFRKGLKKREFKQIVSCIILPGSNTAPLGSSGGKPRNKQGEKIGLWVCQACRTILNKSPILALPLPLSVPSSWALVPQKDPLALWVVFLESANC